MSYESVIGDEIKKLREQRDTARDWAVRLEQENAQLEAALAELLTVTGFRTAADYVTNPQAWIDKTS